MGARTGYQTPSKRPRAGSWLCSATWGLEGNCRWKVTPGARSRRNINHWLSVCSRFIFSIFLTW